MTRFNFVFLMSAVGFVAALKCPAADKTGSPLSSAGTTSDGFVSCRYPQARTCTYFSNGGFSSGSSDCPDQLSGAATASCPIVDNAGSELQSSTIDDDGFLACGYATSFCTYFLNGGFSSGSSVCPSSADVVDNTPPPPPTSVCPPTDNSGGALVKQGTLGTFISCDYETSFCTYFTNGGFDSGSSLCPSSIGSAPPARRSASTRTASCPIADNAGSDLQSSTIDDDGFLACGYATSFCTYFLNGGFSSGSSVCPASADVVDNTPPSTSTGACPPTDNAGGAFIEEGMVGTFISCEYEVARVCTYFTNGGFDSGSSDCPSSIPNTRSAKFSRRFRA